MSDFSRSPLELLLESRRKGYVGLHIQQGVPLLDRDLNLLQDFIVAEVRALFSRFVGDGVPAASDGFRIGPSANQTLDFSIGAGPGGGPGVCLVGGIEVPIASPVDYSRQIPPPPPLTTPGPGATNPRQDTVYLDAWIVEVDGSTDDTLTNSDDIGMETSTRLAVRWAVRVAEGAPVPPAETGHVQYPLARLRRPRDSATISAPMITDLRQQRLTLADLERRLSLTERVLLLPGFAATVPFTPAFGVAGQPIQINGVNLDVGTLQVFFGDQLAQLVGTPSATQVVARVPTGSTPSGTRAAVPITLSNEGGKAVSTDTFEVRPAPAFAPPGQQFAPQHAPAGSRVVISGFNFNTGDVVVTFGSKQATIVGTPTNTQVTVLVPAGLIAPPAPPIHKITVASQFGLKISDDTFQAELGIPAPTLDQGNEFSPLRGQAGAPVTLNGQNLNNDPKVKFDTADATLTGPMSSSQITVQVPAGLATPGQQKKVTISVTTPGGTASTTSQFVVLG
jgi:hypothetical protein